MTLESYKPIAFTADMNDNIDPSDLIPSYQPSDLDWLNKDPFEILPWDLSGIEQNFTSLPEGNGLSEFDPCTSYTTSNHGSPAGYKGYTVKTEEVMSDESPISDAESDTWSPICSNGNKSGSQSPVDVIDRNHESKLLFSRESAKPTTEHANNARKASHAFSSSTSPSPLTSPKLTITTPSSRVLSSNKPVRSTTNGDPDAAAVMKRKKAAHNAIEKRYRTNMNAKFLALGNAIPRSGAPFHNTQTASGKGPRKHSLCHGRENMSSVRRSQHEQQQQANQQQNKSEILTNALSYINQLQDENSRLKSELLVLKENLLPGGNIMWRR